MRSKRLPVPQPTTTTLVSPPSSAAAPSWSCARKRSRGFVRAVERVGVGRLGPVGHQRVGHAGDARVAAAQLLERLQVRLELGPLVAAPRERARHRPHVVAREVEDVALLRERGHPGVRADRPEERRVRGRRIQDHRRRVARGVGAGPEVERDAQPRRHAEPHGVVGRLAAHGGEVRQVGVHRGPARHAADGPRRRQHAVEARVPAADDARGEPEQHRGLRREHGIGRDGAERGRGAEIAGVDDQGHVVAVGSIPPALLAHRLARARVDGGARGRREHGDRLVAVALHHEHEAARRRVAGGDPVHQRSEQGGAGPEAECAEERTAADMATARTTIAAAHGAPPSTER